MSKIVSMINWKGGVGKSTATLNIGAGLAKFSEFENSRVLLVDLDPQTNLSYSSMGVDDYIKWAYTDENSTLKDLYNDYLNNEDDFDVNDALVKDEIKSKSNFHLLPSHLDLIFIDMKLARKKEGSTELEMMAGEELNRLSILSNLFKEIEKNYDYIICDCPPNFNLVTQNAIFASESYIIPALPDFLSTVGMQQIVQEVSKLNERVRKYINLYDETIMYTDTELKGIIFTRVKEYGGRPKASHLSTIDRIRRQFNGLVFGDGGIYVTDGDGLVKASDNFLSIYDYAQIDNSSVPLKQAGQYKECTREFFNRV